LWEREKDGDDDQEDDWLNVIWVELKVFGFLEDWVVIFARDCGGR
jgi:hypothetical protein